MRQANRREVILATAAKMFKEKGYANTSLREIAAAVGVSKPALYYFFASKDDLLLEVVRIPVEWSNEAVERIVNSDIDPREKLRQAILSMARDFDLYPDETAVYVSQENVDFIAPHVREYIMTNKRHYSGMWERIIAEGIAKAVFRCDLHLRVATFGALEMVRGMAKWYKRGRELTAEEIGEIYARMLLNSFALSAQPSSTETSPVHNQA